MRTPRSSQADPGVARLVVAGLVVVMVLCLLALVLFAVFGDDVRHS